MTHPPFPALCSSVRHVSRAALAVICAVFLSLPALVGAAGPPVAAAVSLGLTGCSSDPAAQAASMDASIAGYERSVMRLHAAGMIDDDDLRRAHAFALAGREAIAVMDAATTPQEQARAAAVAEAKLDDLAGVVLQAGGEPPGSPGVFGP